MDTKNFDQNLQALETETGKRVAMLNLQLDVLKQNGLLIDIDIQGTGMFDRKASFLELGVGHKADDTRKKRYTAGRKHLIDQELAGKLHSITTRFRQLNDKYCRDISGFRPYRWMPKNSYFEFRAKWDSLAQEFQLLKDEIIARYDEQVDALAEDFAEGARETWAGMTVGGYDAVILKSGDNALSFSDRDAFVDWVVTKALEAMPSRQKIEAGLVADYKVAIFQTEYDVEAAKARVEEAMANAHAAKTQAWLQDTQAQEAAEHQKRMNQLEQLEAEQKLEEKEISLAVIRAAELEHAKAQLEKMQSPFEEVFLALREQIAKDCQKILESFQNNGYLNGKVAERAAGLVGLYDLMAAHNDKELRAKLVELRSQIGLIGGRDKNTPERNPAEIKATLAEIVSLAHVEASDLAEISRAAFLEL